jgi:hypothetical protein
MIGLRSLVREPLFLFTLLGVLLYFFFSSMYDRVNDKQRAITVSPAQIELLTTSFEKTWNRPPSEPELQAQINNFIMDEVFYMEAVAMGLDKKDPAVKRRLRQIMEMMLDDFATVYPTESQLQQFLIENAEDFRLESTISFEHLYFKEDQKDKAISTLPKLNSGKISADDLTNNLLLLPRAFQDETEFQIERQFGKEFTNELFRLDAGSWLGPVASAYGWHLVRIQDKREGTIPDLAEVRDQVEREWMVVQRNQIKEKQYERLRSNYDITIVYPE